MFHKFLEIFTNYYCRRCGAFMGSTDNDDDSNNHNFTCSDCG